MDQGKWIPRIVIIVFLLVLISSFFGTLFLTLKPGERGVVFKRFGGGLDKEVVYTPGFHVIAPWNKMYVYNVKEQQLDDQMDVLSSNGLHISLDVTVRTHPNYGQIGFLHEKFGNQYISTLVRPEVRSSVRKIIGRYTPEEIYSTKRDEVEKLINKDLHEVLDKNYVNLKTVLFRSVKLPQTLQTAIERKLKQEQESLEYEYRLEKERKEAQRRIIEAEAKAEANRIVSASLNDKILKDKGIEATLELAKSPNSKVIVVGGDGGDGLPLILGGN